MRTTTEPLPPCSWPEPPGALSLGSGEVHLWCASLEPAESEVAPLRDVLSEDECRRAADFLSGPLRNRFIVGRARLRLILARYLAVAPRAIRFQYCDLGKPVLAAPWNGGGLSFNLAHSRALAVYAVAADRDVGVDIEGIRPLTNMTRLIERWFAPEEIEQWRQLPLELRTLGFFSGWTRKEAWLKAVGSGLSFPLDQIVVSLTPEGPARIVSIRGDARAADAWWMDGNSPAPGYVAAVAVRGEPVSVSRWRWLG
jgi:4'-phosphopantetheinyl transferase